MANNIWDKEVFTVVGEGIFGGTVKGAEAILLNEFVTLNQLNNVNPDLSEYLPKSAGELQSLTGALYIDDGGHQIRIGKHPIYGFSTIQQNNNERLDIGNDTNQGALYFHASIASIESPFRIGRESGTVTDPATQTDSNPLVYGNILWSGSAPEIKYNAIRSKASDTVAGETSIIFSKDTNSVGSGGTVFLEIFNDGRVAGAEATNGNQFVTRTQMENNAGIAAIVRVDQGNGLGYIPYGRNNSLFGNVGYGALDLSDSDGSIADVGATGTTSLALGYNVKALGYGSFAMGEITEANGSYAIVTGYDNIGGGYASFTTGAYNRNPGHYNLMGGVSNISGGGGMLIFGSALDSRGGDRYVVIGQNNIVPTGNPYWFQVGNGTVSGDASVGFVREIPSDAFRVYKTGLIEAPSLTNDFITNGDISTLTTKGWILAQGYGTGSGAGDFLASGAVPMTGAFVGLGGSFSDAVTGRDQLTGSPTIASTELITKGYLDSFGYRAYKAKGTAGEAVVYGDIVVMKLDGKWWKASSTTTEVVEGAPVMFVYTGAAADGETEVVLALSAPCTYLAGACTSPIGSIVYLSETAGVASFTLPTAGVVRFIGRMAADSNGWFAEDRFIHYEADVTTIAFDGTTINGVSVGGAVDLTGYVPYVGGTNNLDLTGHKITLGEPRRVDLIGDFLDLIDTNGFNLLKYQTHYYNGSYGNSSNSLGFGRDAIKNNRATGVLGIGASAMRDNIGRSSLAIGSVAGILNEGGYVTGIGFAALYRNKGSHCTAIGEYSLSDNEGDYNLGIGTRTFEFNTGSYNIGIGNFTLRFNDGIENVAIGHETSIFFKSGYKVPTAVSSAEDTITIPNHGFGAVGEEVYLLFTSDNTEGIRYLTPDTVYKFSIIDTWKIKPIGRTISSINTGADNRFYKSENYNNTAAIGAYASPNKSNQVMLGDDRIISIKTGNPLYSPIDDDDLATKLYVDTNAGSGGIGEAPENGNLYGRKDALWEQIVTAGGGIDEPSGAAGNYVRAWDGTNGSWVAETTGGSGTTNLSLGTRTQTTMPLVSSSGSGVDLLLATTAYAGLMSKTQFDKLGGIEVSANNYSHLTTAGNKHIPAGGTTGQMLYWSALGTAVWDDAPDGGGSSHTHANKTVLDGITSTLVSEWNAAFTHSGTAHAPSNATHNSTDAALRARSSHTGTQLASTISNFDTEVGNNTTVVANSAYRAIGHVTAVTGSGNGITATTGTTPVISLKALTSTGWNAGTAGNITAKNFVIGSDRRLKNSIEIINGSDIFRSFRMNVDESQIRFGAIAQEVERRYPEVVRTDEEGMKSIAYTDLLVKRVAELEERLEKLEQALFNRI